MTGDNFVLYMEHSVKRTRLAHEKPVFILLVNHQQYLNIKILDLAKEIWSGYVISISYLSQKACLNRPVNESLKKFVNSVSEA
jgi:hypothetical protein